MDDDIIIQFNELPKALNECYNHVHELVKIAKHLHHNHKFTSSIFFSIIAFEEFGKLSAYSSYFKKHEGVPKKEITKLVGHTYKLKKLMNFYEEGIIDITESEFKEKRDKVQLKLGFNEPTLKNARKDLADLKEFLTSLDYVKQLILYYDFREGRTITLSNQITDNHLGHLSLFLLEFVAFFMNYEHVRFSYSKLFFTIPEEKNLIAKNESWKNCKDFAKRIRSDKFKPSIGISFRVIKEIKLLYHDLKKRDLLLK